MIGWPGHASGGRNCSQETHAYCVLTSDFITAFAAKVEAKTNVATDCTEEDGVPLQTIRGYYSAPPRGCAASRSWVRRVTCKPLLSRREPSSKAKSTSS